MSESEIILSIRNLSVEFQTRHGVVQAIRDLSMDIQRGEIIGIVGESGSGKSVSALATMGLLDGNGRIASGEIIYRDQVLASTSGILPARKRPKDIAMIFQYPRTALNPIRTVGKQIVDVLKTLKKGDYRSLKQEAIALLDEVRIGNPEERFDNYPFELSGGMCQRILIAMALARKPKLLIADEPTTGLDVVTQEAILQLITEAQAHYGMATVLITHDMGLASRYCERIAVMQLGKLLELQPKARLFANPVHRYTRGLIAATPGLINRLDDLKAVFDKQEESEETV